MGQALGAVQVAALLVSASYGIGFLFESGELALLHGMAGSIYGVATGIGMLLLAMLAGRLWRVGLPVWSLFGRVYGAPMEGAVAWLSLVWMSGVLAAQIQGGAAVFQLLGLSPWQSDALVVLLVLMASRMNLRLASGVFSLCLLASGVVLVWALVAADGVGLYLQSIPGFVRDLPSFGLAQGLAMLIAVSLLVCAGADYQQFVLAARTPAHALWGCVLAAVLLVAIGFLPAAVVLAMQQSGALAVPPDSSQVVPWVLGEVAGRFGPFAQQGMLLALSLAALGSGAAVLRAMTSALESAADAAGLHDRARRSDVTRFFGRVFKGRIPAAGRPGQPGAQRLFAAFALGLAWMLAARGQSIVNTMVSVNMVYLASIGVCLLALLLGRPLTIERAHHALLAGFVVSAAVYTAGWAGWTDWLGGSADGWSLASGLLASALAALGFRRQSFGRHPGFLPTQF